jgi:hypothetical protein
VNLGVAAVKSAQSQLNALHQRALKAKEQLEDARKKAKSAEAVM